MNVNGLSSREAARMLRTLADMIDVDDEYDHNDVLDVIDSTSKLHDAADLLEKQQAALDDFATGRSL